MSAGGGSFTCQQQVRFGHVDPAGIAYFPRLFDYVHEAFEELWDDHVGVRYYHLLLEQRIGFPLVHSEVDFRAPLRFGDRPVVRITCFKLGRSSIGLRYQYKLGDTLCFEAKMTTVCTDLETMNSRSLEPEVRAKFEQLLESDADAS